MRGILLSYDVNASAGIISGSDGNRYAFRGAEYAGSPRELRRGLALDFVVKGGNDPGERTAVSIMSLDGERPEGRNPFVITALACGYGFALWMGAIFALGLAIGASTDRAGAIIDSFGDAFWAVTLGVCILVTLLMCVAGSLPGTRKKTI